LNKAAALPSDGIREYKRKNQKRNGDADDAPGDDPEDKGKEALERIRTNTLKLQKAAAEFELEDSDTLQQAIEKYNNIK
jgi:hypothetical protein